jgi:hypothetical protein
LVEAIGHAHDFGLPRSGRMKMGLMLIDDLDRLSIEPRDSARTLKNRFYIGEFWAVRSIFTPDICSDSDAERAEKPERRGQPQPEQREEQQAAGDW